MEDERGNILIGTDYRSGGLFYLDLENKRKYHLKQKKAIQIDFFYFDFTAIVRFNYGINQ